MSPRCLLVIALVCSIPPHSRNEEPQNGLEEAPEPTLIGSNERHEQARILQEEEFHDLEATHRLQELGIKQKDGTSSDLKPGEVIESAEKQGNTRPLQSMEEKNSKEKPRQREYQQDNALIDSEETSGALSVTQVAKLLKSANSLFEAANEEGVTERSDYLKTASSEHVYVLANDMLKLGIGDDTLNLLSTGCSQLKEVLCLFGEVLHRIENERSEHAVQEKLYKTKETLWTLMQKYITNFSQEQKDAFPPCEGKVSNSLQFMLRGDTTKTDNRQQLQQKLVHENMEQIQEILLHLNQDGMLMDEKILSKHLKILSSLLKRLERTSQNLETGRDNPPEQLSSAGLYTQCATSCLLTHVLNQLEQVEVNYGTQGTNLPEQIQEISRQIYITTSPYALPMQPHISTGCMCSEKQFSVPQQSQEVSLGLRATPRKVLEVNRVHSLQTAQVKQFLESTKSMFDVASSIRNVNPKLGKRLTVSAYIHACTLAHDLKELGLYEGSEETSISGKTELLRSTLCCFGEVLRSLEELMNTSEELDDVGLLAREQIQETRQNFWTTMEGITRKMSHMSKKDFNCQSQVSESMYLLLRQEEKTRFSDQILHNSPSLHGGPEILTNKNSKCKDENENRLAERIGSRILQKGNMIENSIQAAPWLESAVKVASESKDLEALLQGIAHRHQGLERQKKRLFQEVSQRLQEAIYETTHEIGLKFTAHGLMMRKFGSMPKEAQDEDGKFATDLMTMVHNTCTTSPETCRTFSDIFKNGEKGTEVAFALLQKAMKDQGRAVLLRSLGIDQAELKKGSELMKQVQGKESGKAWWDNSFIGYGVAGVAVTLLLVIGVVFTVTGLWTHRRNSPLHADRPRNTKSRKNGLHRRQVGGHQKLEEEYTDSEKAAPAISGGSRNISSPRGNCSRNTRRQNLTLLYSTGYSR